MAWCAIAVGMARAEAGSCPWDCGNPSDGAVNILDLLALLRQWGGHGTCDFDSDGVDGDDLTLLVMRWGPCPVVTGACCLGDGQCQITDQDQCTSLGGGGWVPHKLCTDADADRIPDAFERDDCGPVEGCFAGSDPSTPDTDGDGISDGDEVLGTLQGLDLQALGADPLRRDLFVEADWMDDAINGMHSHRPLPEAVEALEAAFGASPLENPCGGPGIALHLDYGQGGPFTHGGLIGDDTVVVFDSEFNEYKSLHFDPRRQGYFRYSIHCHRYNSPDNSSTGVAEILGDDFIVSLAGGLQPWSMATIIMHELGHNLGLRHGGFEGRNYKPNYNSVMNYRFAFPGTDVTCDALGDGVLGYSHGLNPPLDEAALLEAMGVCGELPIDWNSNGQVDAKPFPFNINCAGQAGPCGTGPPNCYDPSCDLLLDYDDWSAVVLRIPPGTDFQAEIVTCLDVPGDGRD
jgi:hypothetical protein